MIEKRTFPMRQPLVILIGIMLVSSSVSHAQVGLTKKSKSEVIQSALTVSPLIKSSQAQSDYFKALSRNKFDPAKTSFKFDYGNVNSAQNDSRFVVEQTFDLPMVYKQQQNVFASLQKTNEYQILLDQNFIKWSVEQMWLQWQFMLSKQKLLLDIQQLYARQLKIVEARYSVGQDNALEKLNMQNWVAQNHQILLKNTLELEAIQQQFKVILQDSSQFLPIDSLSYQVTLIDTILDKQHPLNAKWQQKLNTAVFETQLQKAKNLPQWSMGVANQSFKVFSTDKERFNSFTVGLNVPLFNKVAKQRVQASKMNEAVVSAEQQVAIQDLRLNVQKSWSNYKQTMELCQYIEKQMLPNARKMGSLATLSFQQGQINYLEWSNAMSQLQQAETQYLDALLAFNLQQSYLQYLLSK
jgi:cobalt-zinc-cadmium resistance protein CzcA